MVVATRSTFSEVSGANLLPADAESESYVGTYEYFFAPDHEIRKALSVSGTSSTPSITFTRFAVRSNPHPKAGRMESLKQIWRNTLGSLEEILWAFPDNYLGIRSVSCVRERLSRLPFINRLNIATFMEHLDVLEATLLRIDELCRAYTWDFVDQSVSKLGTEELFNIHSVLQFWDDLQKAQNSLCLRGRQSRRGEDSTVEYTLEGGKMSESPMVTMPSRGANDVASNMANLIDALSSQVTRRPASSFGGAFTPRCSEERQFIVNIGDFFSDPIPQRDSNPDMWMALEVQCSHDAES